MTGRNYLCLCSRLTIYRVSAGRGIDTGDPSLSPGDAGKLSGGKRWAKVKGVFGALGKFRKSAKQSDAVVTSPRPTPTPARTTHSLSVDQQAATVQLVSSVAGETEQQPTLQSSNAISQISGVAESPSTAPSTAVVSSDTSPLRTSAIEPTSRVASLRTSDPVDEETPLGTGDLTSGPAAPKEIVSPPVCQADQNIAVPLPVSSVPSSPACDGGGHLNLMISEKGREESAHKVRLSAEAYVERSKSKRAFWPGALSHVEQRSKLPLNEHLKSRTLHDQSISLCMGECLPSTWHGRYGTSIRKCHGKRYTELHSADPKSRHERIALRNVTEIEAREIVRRRKLAADSVFREHLRLELERHVCLELDNLERQRARIQAIEAEEEERWRRIEENYIHASTPQRLQAEHKEGLEEILQAEANERTRRMVEDGKQFVSIRYLYVDKFRKSINTELSKFVWPGVESCAPAGVQEVLIPRSRSRQDPASVLYFCVSQRKLLQFPKGELFALEQDLQVMLDPFCF